jgi:hypothetical protein
VSALVAGQVSVDPAEFTQVKYDANEIAAIVTSLAEALGVANTISLVVDETSPLAKITCSIDAPSSDATIVIEAMSGAIENTKQLTTLGRTQTQTSVGRMLLRARDRMRSDFADVGADDDLTLAETAAWDTYCAGRLARAGIKINTQRWRYNHRNRFGFSDAGDADFDRLWVADDLSWTDVIAGIDAD